MIFLGQASNYSAKKALGQLFAHGKADDVTELKAALKERYQGQEVRLYHTGRAALAAAFRGLLPDGGPVIIPGLTCIALVRAASAAHCQPVYVDIKRHTLQYDYDLLEQTVKNHTKSLKSIDKSDEVCYNGIIVAQNTLGLPLEMSKVEAIAKKYHWAIVEDLAHCAGRHYPDGREIGTVGAATALSFGKGKAIDTIEGGALVVRQEVPAGGKENKNDKGDVQEQAQGRVQVQVQAGVQEQVQARVQADTQEQMQRLPRLGDRWRDRWYPTFGLMIRAGYHVKLGKVITAILLKLHWIKKSADAELDEAVTLMPWQAKLALEQLKSLPNSGAIREPILVKKRSELLAKLEKSGFYLNEIWYDTPVSPVRYAQEANFPSRDCPVTMQVSREIINLPTWYSEQKLVPVRAIISEYQLGEQIVISGSKERDE